MKTADVLTAKGVRAGRDDRPADEVRVVRAELARHPLVGQAEADGAVLLRDLDKRALQRLALLRRHAGVLSGRSLDRGHRSGGRIRCHAGADLVDELAWA